MIKEVQKGREQPLSMTSSLPYELIGAQEAFVTLVVSVGFAIKNALQLCNFMLSKNYGKCCRVLKRCLNGQMMIDPRHKLISWLSQKKL